MTAPVPLMVYTKRLLDEMKGSPYQADSKQFMRVDTYGTPENSSVDLFLIILWNVIIGDKNRNAAEIFPKMPKRVCRRLAILVSKVCSDSYNRGLREQIYEPLNDTGKVQDQI